MPMPPGPIDLPIDGAADPKRSGAPRASSTEPVEDRASALHHVDDRELSSFGKEEPAAVARLPAAGGVEERAV